MTIPTIGALITGPAGKDTLCLEECIGRGAFGDVWRAKEGTSENLYAVKFPLLTGFNNKAEIRAFQNEVQAAREIEHPNVVRVVHVEVSPTDLPPYLVMEFVKGGTLKSCLDNIRNSGYLVDIEHLQIWSSGLIDGIAAINKKMLHRDLKPDNILMDGDNPKIGDFGLSKIVVAMTRSGTFKGGQHMLYMAPEGWKLETNEIQIDMYAMGIILYEIASLEYPYDLPSDPRDIEGLKDMHLFQSARPLREIRKDLPLGFWHVISRLLEKRTQDRFADWSEVAVALDNVWDLGRPTKSNSQDSTRVLLEKMGRLHELSSQQRIEKEKRKAESKEQRMLDLLQKEKLVDCLREAIVDFNKQSTIGTIKEINTHSPDIRFMIHGKFPSPRIDLRFFWIYGQPLKISRGLIRFAASLSDSHNIGLNYLLCRENEDDLYGKWAACLVRQHPLAKMPPRLEPFGFENAEEIRHIEQADTAMHIYTVEFYNYIQEPFIKILTQSLDLTILDLTIKSIED